MSDLFEQTVAASRLSPIFARSAIQRALRRAGVDPGALSRRSLRQALPEIARAIEPFLQSEALQVMKDIEALAEPS